MKDKDGHIEKADRLYERGERGEGGERRRLQTQLCFILFFFVMFVDFPFLSIMLFEVDWRAGGHMQIW